MHIHSVFFWLKPELSETDIHEFKQGLRTLLDIPGLVRGYFGRPVCSDRAVVDSSFDFALHLEFADSEDEAKYQVHSLHSEFVKNNADKWLRVQVYDALTEQA